MRMLPQCGRVLAVSEAERRQLDALGVPSDRVRLHPQSGRSRRVRPSRPLGSLSRTRAVWRPAAGDVSWASSPPASGSTCSCARVCARLRQSRSATRDRRQRHGSGSLARQTCGGARPGRRTIFTGLLRGHERLDALADADVVVYPSEHEIFGLVPLEALLVGHTGVVTDDCGCGEVISSVGGGIVVSVGDVPGIARAIDDVLEPPGCVARSCGAGGLANPATFRTGGGLVRR